MMNDNNSNDYDMNLITPKEAANILKLPINSVYRLIGLKIIPSTRVGRLVRIDRKQMITALFKNETL